MREEEFPYSDWLRASPMKFVNVMLANAENTRDVLRRSFFKDDRLHQGTQVETREGDSEDKDPQTEAQVTQRVDISGKVEVSGMKSKMANADNGDPTRPASGHEQTQNVTQNVSFSNNIIHPTTKTTSSTIAYNSPVKNKSLPTTTIIISPIQSTEDPPSANKNPTPTPTNKCSKLVGHNHFKRPDVNLDTRNLKTTHSATNQIYLC